jgi:uncharacterized phiE125 gp8 family phage protein
MGLKVLMQPQREPVSLADAKQYLRIDHTDEDVLIEVLITSARVYVENYLKRALITQILEYSLPSIPYPATELCLPNPPLQSVMDFSYIDTSGVSQTWTWTEYQVCTEEEPGKIKPAYSKSWPSYREQYGAIKIKYLAGYGSSPSDVPQPIREGLLAYLAHRYEHRDLLQFGQQQVSVIPYSMQDMLFQYRIIYP